METKQPGFAPHYNDRLFRVAVAATGALMASEFGSGESIFERLLSKYFYIEYFSSLAIALALIELVAYATRQLDMRYGWFGHPFRRTLYQVLLGLVLPGVVDFLLAALYFRLFGLHIVRDTTYMVYAFPFVMLMLLLFNLYYVVYYLFLAAGPHGGPVKGADTPPGRDKGETGRQVIVVNKGGRNIPVQVEGIACCCHEDGHNYLCTFNGEKFLVPHTLDVLETELPAPLFFRASRWVIVHKNACRSFESAKYGKLLLYLGVGLDRPISVSQRKARQFREWMEQ